MLSPKRTKFRKQHKGRIHGDAKGGTDLQKPTEVRMGKGKGSVEYWAAKVKPGRVMFEIDGVTEVVAREALRLAAMKLPVKCRFVEREDW